VERVSADGVDREATLAWVEAFAQSVAENRERLTQLDSAIGDADHGINMHRGMQAALERARAAEGEPAALLKAVGMALLSKVGGAGGPLYGSFFMQFANTCAGTERLSPKEWSAGLGAGIAGVQARGKAERGEKTMIDALAPAHDALEGALSEGAPFGDALRSASEAARAGMEATIDMVARKGRASYLGERSRGHQDPGATSSCLLVQAAASTLAGA
jgi:dihydroxyacetone kinase-like protein